MTLDQDDDELTWAEELFLAFCDSEQLPAREMREALAHWDECRDFFVRIVAEFAEGSLSEPEDADGLPILLHLLEQKRETAAFAPLLRLLSRPIEEVEAILGDTLEESIARQLVALFDGDAEKLEAMILDPRLDSFARWPVIDAYAALACIGRIGIERAERIILAAGTPAFAPDDAAWIGWLRACAALGTPALEDKARKLWDSGVVAPSYYDIKDLEAEFTAWRDDRDGRLERMRPIDDAIAVLSTWHGYSEAGIAERRKAATHGGSIGRDTHVNPYRHVGRNDPCPCGSGKKFKKCHGA